MDNKYGLRSTKVATEKHEQSHPRAADALALRCKYCGSTHLILSATMHDHRCEDCGEWQQDIPAGYSTGRSSDY